MSHLITVNYLRAALAKIEKAEGPFKVDPLAFAESVIEAQVKIAHDALNGEWDTGACECDHARDAHDSRMMGAPCAECACEEYIPQ